MLGIFVTKIFLWICAKVMWPHLLVANTVWDHARHTHKMFVVVLERAGVCSWYGPDEDRRCTGLNEERC
jgi:hypothetical protein